MKVEVYKSKDGWRWRIVSRNGKIVGASSESFTRRAACLRNLKLVTCFNSVLSA